ncbi:MAG: hypothetical protein RI953_1877 [Pseudomonadota bacterium]|jgi:hypothetical protein
MYGLIGHGLVVFSELTNVFLGQEKIHFKKLDSERDLSILQDEFAEADGIRLPLDYLGRGKAFVCFNEQNEPQGGFALIDQGPFRTLEQLPENVVKPSDTSVTEITAVYLNPGHPLRRTRYWSFVVGKALTSDSQRIVYAVDSAKTALRERVFNHIRAHTLYEGPVRKLDGMLTESVEAVELTTKSHLAKGFLKLAILEVGKLSSNLDLRPLRVSTVSN